MAVCVCVYVCASKWLLLGTDDYNLHNGLTRHTETESRRKNMAKEKKKRSVSRKGFSRVVAQSKSDLTLVVRTL